MRSRVVILGLMSIASAILAGHSLPFGPSAAIAQTQDAKAKAAALLEQCRAEVLKNQTGSALGICQNAVKAHQQIGDRVGEGNALVRVGIAYTDLKQYPQALSVLQEALKIGQEYKNLPVEVRALDNLAFLYKKQGQYQKAITIGQEARKISQRTGDRELEAKILLNLGRTYAEINQPQERIVVLQEAIILCESKCGFANNRPFKDSLLALVQWDLGIAYFSSGQYLKGIEYHEKALKIYRANPISGGNRIVQFEDESDILSNMGRSYVALGQYQRGIDLYRQASVLLQGTQDAPREKTLKRNLDEVYRRIGYPIDFINTEEVVKEMQRRKTQPDKQPETPQEKVQSLQSKAMVARAVAVSRERKGQDSSANLKKALGAYEELLAIAKERGDQKLEADTLSSVGGLYDNFRQFDAAIKTYEKVIEILQNLKIPESEAVIWKSLSDVYAHKGQITLSLQAKQRSLKLWQQLGSRDAEIISLYDLGITSLNAKKFSQAQLYLTQGMNLIKPLRQQLTKDEDRVAIADTQVRLYSALQQSLVSQKNYSAALEVAERSRAQTYAELLMKRISDKSNPTKAPLSIKQLKDTARQQKATIVQYSIITSSQDKPFLDRFAEDWKLRKKLNLKDLPAHTIRSDSSLYVWVIQPNGTLHFRQVSLEAISPAKRPDVTTLAAINQPTVRSAASGVNLSKVIAQSRAGLGLDPRGSINIRVTEANSQNQNELRQLYDLLIKPIETLLPTNPNKQIIFVPQGSLFLVPFAALQNAKGQMLIDKHTLRISPSIQVIALTHQQNQRIKQQVKTANPLAKTLVVGNPIMPKLPAQPNQPPFQLSPLPGSEQEAKRIGQLLKTDVLTADRATETDVRAKMPSAQVIHLATHGLLDYETNETIPGAIALAPSAKDDGFLTSSEIVQMKLQANLVVLSACDTGRGKITGDGVIGLSRSLMTAGVPSVVVSLWAVPDAPTAELMTEFYRQLQRNPDKAQALRQAMLKTRVSHPNPRDWAAFTLMGQAD
jgi:CHAT domain-containing protein